MMSIAKLPVYRGDFSAAWGPPIAPPLEVMEGFTGSASWNRSAIHKVLPKAETSGTTETTTKRKCVEGQAFFCPEKEETQAWWRTEAPSTKRGGKRSDSPPPRRLFSAGEGELVRKVLPTPQ